MNVFIVLASSGQKPQFRANFDIFGGSCSNPLLPWGPNLVCYSRPTVYAYVSNFVSIGLLSLSSGVNPQILPFSGLRQSAYFVVSSVGGNLRKLNTGAQLQTFSFRAVSNGIKIVSVLSKSFLYFAFMAKSGAQSLTFTTWHGDRQWDRHTDRQKKLNVFGRPGGGWNPSPIKFGMVTEDLEHVLAPLILKLLGGLSEDGFPQIFSAPYRRNYAYRTHKSFRGAKTCSRSSVTMPSLVGFGFHLPPGRPKPLAGRASGL